MPKKKLLATTPIATYDRMTLTMGDIFINLIVLSITNSTKRRPPP
jgi:hypothetical protein